MKKIMSIVTVFIFAVALNTSAQLSNNTSAGTTDYKLENVMISSVKAIEGRNTVPVPGSSGAVIQFTKLSKGFKDVTYTDAAGKTVKLQPTSGAANGGTQPSCKCTIPDACFGTADKSIGMCICKPCDLTNGEETYTIAMLLPAVQAAREAATRPRQ